MVNKKGVFFTVTALLMTAVFLASFFVYSHYRDRDTVLVIESRVRSMDNFIEDVEVDIEKGLYISSFRSLLGMLEYISQNQSYVDDVDSGFEELFFNGTMNGKNMSLTMNNTFTEWIERVKSQAQKTGIELTFEDMNVSIRQDDPWGVVSRLEARLIVGDLRNTAYWDRDLEIETRIDINNFEDPIYRIETNGVYLNGIVRTDVTDFVDGDDTSNLMYHVNNSFYSEWSGAPSFLKRMEGDFSADPNGIESLVNVDDLSDQGLTPKTKSVVDYIYFGTSNPTSYQIEDMPSWFRLDDLSNNEGNSSHLVKYEVQNKTI